MGKTFFWVFHVTSFSCYCCRLHCPCLMESDCNSPVRVTCFDTGSNALTEIPFWIMYLSHMQITPKRLGTLQTSLMLINTCTCWEWYYSSHCPSLFFSLLDWILMHILQTLVCCSTTRERFSLCAIMWRPSYETHSKDVRKIFLKFLSVYIPGK